MGPLQFDDAMKFLEEVRLRLPDKSWREHARNAWDISPSLAVFLPQRLNSSAMLEAEVSRLVRLRPEDVCHIPRALDFFLTKVGWHLARYTIPIHVSNQSEFCIG